VSDASQGPGWWQASDGKWYAPELHPSARQPQVTQPIPDFGSPSQPVKQSEDWYRRPWVIVVALIVFFPVGLVLMWMSGWKMPTKVIVTVAFAALVIAVAATSKPPPKNTQAAVATSSTQAATTTVRSAPTRPPATTTVPPTTAPPTTAPPTTAPPTTSPPTTAAPATASSCTPLSDEGTCYEPGEYCRDSDHGASGVAGDGESITCEDNDGWRWEPT
jgi:hypothetical protein